MNKGWKSSLAAFIGNCGTLLVFPLETIKTRFQVADGASNNLIPKYSGIVDAFKKITKNEGYRSLYRGVAVYFAAFNVANMSFFYVYGFGKGLTDFEAKPTPAKALGISFASSVSASTISAPFWTLKTRLNCFVMPPNLPSGVKLNPKSAASTLKYIFWDLIKKDGPKGLFHGYTASLVLCGQGTIQMVVYEGIKDLTGKLSGFPQAFRAFLNGALSRVIATTIMYPVTTIRTRIQSRQYTLGEMQMKSGNEVLYRGVLDSIKKTWRQNGIKSFYQGFTATIAKNIPAQGIFFLLYVRLLLLYLQYM